MVESFLAVPLHFTAEFVGFLVMAGAAILLAARPVLIPGERSNRVTAAVGFGLLATAQVAHGGGFDNFQVDGDRVLIGLRAVGLLLVLFGLLGGLRIRAVAVAGWEPKEPLMLASAVAALLVAIVALRGARGAGSKALRWLSLGMFLFGVGQLVGSAAPGVEFGGGVVSIPAYSEHALEVAGFICIAMWLRAASRVSIRTRFVTAFAALLVAVVLALASALTGVISRNVQTAELEDVELQLDASLADIADSTAQLKNDIEAIEQAARGNLAEGGNPVDLARQARELESFEFDFVMFLGRDGTLLGYNGVGPTLRRDRRLVETEFGADDVTRINGTAVVDEVVSGRSEVSASAASIGSGTVALVAVRAVADPDVPSRTIAVVVGGNYLDALTMEAISNRFKPGFASLVINNKTVATELPRQSAKKKLVPRDVASQIQSGDIVTEQTVFGDRSYATAYGPILSGSQDVIATLILSNPARVIIEARQGLTGVLFIVAMAAGAVAVVLAWVSGARITKPIQQLTATAGAVREGNLEVLAPVSGQDEVGQLGETFNEMTSSLLRMTSDLREAAAEEHRLRARIETIIQSMADGLIAVDAKKRVLAFNRQAEHLTGLRSGDVLGRPIEEVLEAKDSQGTAVRLPIFDLDEGSVDGIFVENAEKRPVPVTVVSAPLTAEDGSKAGGVLVMRDMTREREVERMKTEFLSNISHELRTPLTPIKGYAEILGRKDIPPDKSRKFVEGILESTSRLERIVQLLVDFSAMEAGRLAPRSGTVDISGMVEKLAAEWSSKSDRHELVTEIDRGVPPVVGDERLIRRSLEEVLDNALKFSPLGGTVRLEVRPSVSANGRARPGVEVTVSDEGIGIPPEDLTKIFADFQQLDGSETRAFGGLGLGLAFVQRIVEAHEGTVSVESRPQEGTRVTIDIPAAVEN